MSRISEIGDQIFGHQVSLNLDNPTYYNKGINEIDLLACPPLRDFFLGTELVELYSWRNGVGGDVTIPMSRLWIIPGFYIISAQHMTEENEYFSARVDGWQSSWYPLLSEGSADRLFVDSKRIVKGRDVPVFYAFWESSQPLGQIYDSLESMMNTILQCYEHGIYYIDEDGFLNRHLLREAEIAKCLNPNSDYWKRSDL